jgi:hypothetical protein
MSAIVLFNQQRIRDRQKREALVEAFHRADKNGDGRLSVDEVLSIYVEHGVDVTRDEVQRMVDAADKDGTGLLTQKEFVNSQNRAAGGGGGGGRGGGAAAGELPIGVSVTKQVGASRTCAHVCVCCCVGRSVGWSVGRSVGRSVGQSVGRSVGRSVGWSVEK